MSLGDLEIVVGRERLSIAAVAPVFGTDAGAEVAVSYGAPATATLHVYAREIADGALTCSLGARRAAVTMDLRLAARILSEGLRRGLTLAPDDAAVLSGALAISSDARASE
ncbi:MAG: hypothetical protein QM699_04770 [Amaricoccus sp.]|uniref:hypothetical protein n=1 Tax=Amaricoccus sp. TaxID=1872485 RepID=UPI0039E6538F